MLSLLLGLVVIAAVLSVLFWFGSQSLQSFLYTSASEGLYWQAPAAAAVVAIFFFVWSFLNSLYARPGVNETPFGVPWEFTMRVDLIEHAVPQIESKRLTSEPAIYQVDRSGPFEIRYRKKDSAEFWNPVGTEYVKFLHNDVEYYFVPDRTRTLEEGYIVFVDAGNGLEMTEFEIGRVGYTSWTRLAVYFLLILSHLVLWIVCFWLLLRFEFWHSVWLGIAMWMLFTLLIMPAFFASLAIA